MAVAASHEPATAPADEPPRRAPGSPGSRAPRVLLAALMAVLFAASFWGDSTDVPDETRLQLGLVVITAGAAAAWLYGNGIRLAASPLAWVGVGLLVAFAVWTGASIAWSVAPDLSWIELNRGIEYVLAIVCGIALGASLPRARERWANALAGLIVVVALYAVAGKTIPGLDFFGLVNLDQAAVVARLRAPLEYWNALALLCVFGVPLTLRLAADPESRTSLRLASLAGLYLLVVVIGMTYSRGGVLAGAVALGTFIAFTTHRVRALALFWIAAIFATLPLTFALTSPVLTANNAPLAQREDAALTVLVALLVGAAIVVVLGLLVVRLERRRSFSPARGRRVGRILAIGFAGLIALSFVNALATGTLSDALDTFTEEETQAGVTDPNRLLSTTSGNRWTWWQEAAGAWSDKPLEGWGAGSFPVTHKRYRTKLLDVRQPHNVPLQFMAETGVIGGLLGIGGLLALLAAGLARTRETPWSVERAGPLRPAAAALVAIPAAWLAHCVYDWDWDLPGVTLPMLVTAGVIVARPPLRPGLGGGGPGLRGLGFAGVIAVLVLVTVSAALPALAETRAAAAVEAAGDEDATDAELVHAAADAELAARLNPLSVEPLIAGSSIAERRGRTEEARRLLLRALERQPENPEIWFALARLELQRLDRAAIREVTARALELDPVNPGYFGAARRAQSNSALPGESATATGSPLPIQVPITDPAAGVGAPGAVAPATPAPAPVPTPTIDPALIPTPFATPTPTLAPFPTPESG